MSEVIGIGAAPRRKEDLRFLTGRGNYVADIERPSRRRRTAGVPLALFGAAQLRQTAVAQTLDQFRLPGPIAARFLSSMSSIEV